VAKKRILYYDIILCICIFASFLVHTATHYYADEVTVWWQLLVTGSAALIIMGVGGRILPLHEGGTSFVKRRLRTFLPEFIVYSLVYIALAVFLGDGEAYMPMRHLAWLAFVPSFGSAWFIYALIGVYLFAPVISPWIARASKRSIEYFLAIWLFSGFIPMAEQFLPVRGFEVFSAQFTTYLGYTVAGYYLVRWPMRERPRREQGIFYAAMFVLGVLGGLYITSRGLRYGYFHVALMDNSINVMAFTLMEFALLQHITRAPKVIEWIVGLVSRNSLHIYLLHMGIIMYVLLPLNLPFLPTLLLANVVPIAAGWALTRLIGRK
jgi:surface polysaccharide O-acyltransferase-like enzyme